MTGSARISSARSPSNATSDHEKRTAICRPARTPGCLTAMSRDTSRACGSDRETTASHFWLALLLLALCARTGYADSVALVKSYDSKPYDAAISGFLKSCDNEITEYNLDGEADGSDDVINRITQSQPDLI